MRKDLSFSRFSSLSYAIVIAVNRYVEDEWVDLSAPAHDSELLHQTLTARDGCAIPKENTLLLNGERGVLAVNTAKAQIEEFLAGLPSHAALTLYFAGHGVSNDEQFYLCFSDTRSNNLRQTALSSEYLEQHLKNIGARGILLLLDCCYSAGFAEKAPDLFRELGKADFRVLISASRAGQPSWELHDNIGTLFTQAIIEVLSGEQAIGNGGGLIYFSDLFSHIRNQLAEEIQRRNIEHLSQEPVFAGVYSDDPLLFVNKERTFNDIKVRTVRYSPLYVRRLIQRIVATTAVIVSFAIGTWYAVLDKSEYADISGDYITIYRGHPQLNAFGFPYLVRETDIPSSAVKQEFQDDNSTAIFGGIGRTIGSALHKFLMRPYKELHQLRSGEQTEVLRSLRDYFSSPEFIAGNHVGGASVMYGELAEDVDIPTLLEMASNSRSDVKAGAFVGLFRLSPDIALDNFDRYGSIGDRHFQRTILPLLAGDPERVKALLVQFFSLRGMAFEHSLIFDAALRNQVTFDMETLWLALTNTSEFSQVHVANYVALTGQVEQWINYLVERLPHTDSLDAARLLYELAQVNPNDSIPSLIPYIREGDEWSRRNAIIAAIAQQQIKVSDLSIQELSDGLLLTEVSKHQVIEPKQADQILHNIDPAEVGISDASGVVSSLRPFLSKASIPVLKEFLSYRDPNDIPSYLHAAAINALCDLNALDPKRLEVLASRESHEVVEASLHCLRAKEPEKVERLLLNRIDREYEDFVAELLLRLPLSQRGDEQLDSLLEGTSTESSRAATILATTEDVDYVLQLLTHPKISIRNGASDAIYFNPKFDQIAKAYARLGSNYDSVGIAIEQNRKKVEYFRKLIENTPPSLLTWRVSISAYWQNLPEGLQRWLDQEIRLAQKSESQRVRESET